MIKGIIFSSCVRGWSVFGWISIICFTLTISSAAGQSVKLQTDSQVTLQCGQNASLICDATSTHQLDVKLFSWIFGNKTVCKNENGQSHPEGLCEVKTSTSNFIRFTLPLRNVMPDDKGNYLCKIRSNKGINSSPTFVTVQDCLGTSNFSTNDSHATCWFSGVYPSGTVHWFRGDVNLTNSASSQTEMDLHGRFSVLSTVDIQKGNLHKPYNCSLWIPSAGKYLSSHLVYMVGGQGGFRSSGSMVKLQWISVMVEIVMLKFMT